MVVEPPFVKLPLKELTPLNVHVPPRLVTVNAEAPPMAPETVIFPEMFSTAAVEEEGKVQAPLKVTPPVLPANVSIPLAKWVIGFGILYAVPATAGWINPCAFQVITLAFAPKALLLPKLTPPPAAISNPPVKVFAPLSMVAPLPSISIPPTPAMTLLIVTLPASPVSLVILNP